MIRKSLLTIFLALFCAITAFAQDSGFYIGAGVGQAKAKDACAPEAGVVYTSCDDKDTAWKILAGYDFNRNFAIEGGWTDLGKVSASGTVLGIPASADVSSKGWELVGVGSIPFNDKFSAYAKGGIYRWRVKGNAVAVGFGTASVNETGTDLTYGIGLRYNFTKSVGARLEWQRFNDVGDSNTTGKSDVDLLSVGVVIKF
jgi:OOP family OmpA-OmpF porin